MTAERGRKHELLALSVLAVLAFAGAVQGGAAGTARVMLAAGHFDWDERLAFFAFAGIDMALISRELDARLAPDAPVALGARLLRDEFTRQRFTEALYPRPVRQSSPYVLDGAAPDEALLPGQEALARLPDGSTIRLTPAPARKAPLAEPSRSVAFPLVLGALALLFVTACGFGVLAALRIRLLASGMLCAALLGGAALLALGFHLCTWFNVAPARLTAGLFTVAVAAAALFWRRGVLRRQLAPMRLGRIRIGLPESALAGLLVIFLTARAALMPIGSWDGRSVWFLHAHQMAERGRLALDEVTAKEMSFAQNAYPLFVPAIAATAGGALQAWDERPAQMGLAALQVAALCLFCLLARRQMGRSVALAATALLFFSPGQFSTNGMTDGVLATLLLVEWLALTRRRTEALGLLVALCAALTKNEGAVLAGVVALVAVAFRRRWRRLPYLAACIAPATAHKAWSAYARIGSAFDGIRWTDVAAHFGERLLTIFSAVPHAASATPVLWQGPLVFLVGALFRTPRATRESGQAITIAILSAVFVFVAMMLTPLSLSWHLETSLDRTLSHASSFFLLAGALFLGARGGRRGAARSTPARVDVTAPR